MSEKCKTCEHWKLPGDCTVFGDCRKLPSIIGIDKLSVTVPYDFYCAGHTSKVEVPKITSVMVERASPTGGLRFDHYAVCSPEVQDAADAFLAEARGRANLTKPRDEQDGG